MASSKSRILIIGATGFIGRHFTEASLAAGHPTFLLIREFAVSSNPEKAKLLEAFQASGANIIHGSVEDYTSLVEAIKKADVVISAVGCLQLMSQMNIIKAIKEVGTIKRFLPSEYGVDYKRIYDPVGPIKVVVDDSLKIRRAVEAEGIPYTYIIGNLFAAYFVPSLGQLILNGIPPRDKIAIYGDGNSKVSFLKEEDVAKFTIKTVDDPRTLNKSLHFMPPANTMSVNELVGIWEKMIGRTMEKTYVSETHSGRYRLLWVMPRLTCLAVTWCILEGIYEIFKWDPMVWKPLNSTQISNTLMLLKSTSALMRESVKCSH